jgi:hypothetical protein
MTLKPFEELSDSGKYWRLHPKYSRHWCKEHKRYYKAYNEKYYKEHKQYFIDYNRERYANDPHFRLRVLAYNKDWRRRNPHYEQKRRMRKLGFVLMFPEN